MAKYRIEKDSLGEVKVPHDKYYGAQTQRSLENFKVGNRRMPLKQIKAMALVKKASARANFDCGVLNENKLNYITLACDAILNGELDNHFVLSVYQTGSGTQSNMNVNEVIANYGNALANAKIIHPNDDVNQSQSSNDVFPTAMHLATVPLVEEVIQSLDTMIRHLEIFIEKDGHHLKVGRTHLQDATNLTVAQEFSGYVSGLLFQRKQLGDSLPALKELAIGGTAVGTGLNIPSGYLEAFEKYINLYTSGNYTVQNNKFEQLSLKSAMSHTSSILKNLAMTLFKIANDLRFLASGPRFGLGELILPANEPGSSIMPGKINPTQAESMMMVGLSVVGNDEVIGLAHGLGNFELNVMMPIIIDRMIDSCTLLSDSMISFSDKLLAGLKVNEQKLADNVERNLMSATELNPYLGYDVVSTLVQQAYQANKSVKEVGIQQGLFTEDQYEKWMLKNHEK